eukprot:3826295-Amphidinium_carterae.1
MIEAKWKNSARGIVWKDGSYGVRFSPDDCREHRVSMGKPTGDVWQISGLPFDMDEKAVCSLLAQCQWDAQLIASSRRVRGGASSWRARSDKEPGAASEAVLPFLPSGVISALLS